MSLLNEFLFWLGILVTLLLIIWNIYSEWKKDQEPTEPFQLTLTDVNKQYEEKE
jgi:tellurite resistance protein TehA-like permease